MPLIKQNVGGGTDWSKTSFFANAVASTAEPIVIGITGKGILTNVFNQHTSAGRSIFIQVDNSPTYQTFYLPPNVVTTIFVPFQNTLRIYAAVGVSCAYNLL